MRENEVYNLQFLRISITACTWVCMTNSVAQSTGTFAILSRPIWIAVYTTQSASVIAVASRKSVIMFVLSTFTVHSDRPNSCYCHKRGFTRIQTNRRIGLPQLHVPLQAIACTIFPEIIAYFVRSSYVLYSKY